MVQYTCRPAGALGLWGFNIAIYISPRWGFNLWQFRLSIHIALLPDKSGFKTGMRELDTSAFYRHIAPLERKYPCCPVGVMGRASYTQPVGRDSYLDMRLSILENRPTIGQPRGLPLQIPTKCRGRSCVCPNICHFTAFFASLNFSLANALHSFSFWFRKSGACHFVRDNSSASTSVIGT